MAAAGQWRSSDDCDRARVDTHAVVAALLPRSGDVVRPGRRRKEVMVVDVTDL